MHTHIPPERVERKVTHISPRRRLAHLCLHFSPYTPVTIATRFLFGPIVWVFSFSSSFFADISVACNVLGSDVNGEILGCRATREILQHFFCLLSWSAAVLHNFFWFTDCTKCLRRIRVWIQQAFKFRGGTRRSAVSALNMLKEHFLLAWCKKNYIWNLPANKMCEDAG